MEQKCKNCKWWRKEEHDGVCVAGDSEEVAEYTDAEYGCKWFEEKEA